MLTRFIFYILVFWMVAGVTKLNAQDTPQLFTAPETIANTDAEILLEPDMFTRGVLLNLNITAIQATTDDTVFKLNVMDLKDQAVTLSLLEAPSTASKAWHGAFNGGEITIVLRQGAVMKGNNIERQTIPAGTLRTEDGKVFQIRHIEDNQIIVREFDSDRFPEELEPIVPDEPMPPVRQENAAKAADPFEFAVAVFYTKKAKDGAGGTSKIEAMIDLAVAETNAAYAASKVNAKIRLVHKALTSDSESGGFEKMLPRLQKTSDGHMDEVHIKRNQYKADLVVLICEDKSKCGFAYIMKTESASFSKWAFSVVNRECATGYYSFGHELGHNMGCCHDKANQCENVIHPYAYGWHFKKDRTEYRTIMALFPGNRIRRFSNPNVKYVGIATGKLGKAENYKTINNTADTVSAFR